MTAVVRGMLAPTGGGVVDAHHHDGNPDRRVRVLSSRLTASATSRTMPARVVPFFAQEPARDHGSSDPCEPGRQHRDSRPLGIETVEVLETDGHGEPEVRE